MSTYSDDFRQEMVDLKDELTDDLVSGGLIFREDAVMMATATFASADDALGEPGTSTVVYTEITPRPKFDKRDQWRTRGGAAVKVGDAVARVSRSITLSEIESASWFGLGVAGLGVEDGTGFVLNEDGSFILVDGYPRETYTLVQGEVKRGALEWTIVLKREAQ